MTLSRTLPVLLLLFVTTPAGAQSVDLIGDRLADTRRGFFELGPFYATPTVRFSGGYDSNALSTPDPQSDVAALFGPGIRLGLPMGSSAFLDVFQEVDFVYYKENVDLRRIFDVTRIGGGWGGRRYLLLVNNEFRDETRRPTSEFDFPVETRQNNFDASLTLALGWRHELQARYEQSRSKILESSVDDETIPERLNHIRDAVTMDFARHLSAKTNAVVEVFYEKLDFEDPTRDSNSYGMRAGFDFSPGSGSALVPTTSASGLSGELLLGFRKLAPLNLTRVDYAGLIGSADVNYTSKSGHRLNGLYHRDVMPSVLGANWYFVEQRLGGSFRWQLHERFSIEPGVVVGRNEYPLPIVTESEGELITQEIEDEHLAYRLSLTYGIRPGFDVGVSSEYFDRRSNVFIFEKNRLLVSFFMSLAP